MKAKKCICGMLTAGMMVVAPQLWAVPAKPGPVSLVQPDGTALTVNLHGDESFHFYTTTDGYLISRDDNGQFCYVDSENRISEVAVSELNNRTAEERAFLSRIDKEKQKAAVGSRWKAARQSLPMSRKASYPTTGRQKGLVVLVEFTDVKFRTDSPRERFSAMLNEENYSGQGALGSAADYYRICSGGAFEPEFDVFGPVQLSHAMDYYGGNGFMGSDRAPEEMVIEACRQLDGEIDFSEYDRDNDGYVDNVYVFYAGYGEASGGSEDSVWPHSWDIVAGAQKYVTLDGVTLDHYACSNELRITNEMEGIGTFCHEFNHVLGLPDLYATSYTNSFTPGTWSVMDQGSYNNNGITPPYMTAYERYALGWMEPVEIGGPDNLTLESIAENKAYIIRTQKENEYFLLENRQQTGWDTYIPGHGMLVWHIDYDESVWYMNTVNNTPSHQYVDVEEADGTRTDYTRDGDAFPGTNGVTEFTDDTKPSMRTWDNAPTGKPITEIRERNGVITFLISGGGQPVEPVMALPATDVSPVSFTANWEASDEADCYLVSVYRKAGSDESATIDYIDGFKDLEVRETQLPVSGLEPETEYYYSVKVVSAYGSKSESSNEVKVTTEKLTFEYSKPVALPADQIGAAAFRANWEELPEADGYELSVYTKTYERTNVEDVTFFRGLGALPEGWTTTSEVLYTLAGYFGKASPSLKLSEDLHQIETPLYQESIRSLSFWYRGVNCSPECSVAVFGNIGGSWTEIDRIQDISNEKAGVVYSLSALSDVPMPDDCLALRIVFEKSGAGSLALDDIAVVYGGEAIVEYLPDYEGADVGNVVSAEVVGLQPESVYYYQVCGYADGGLRSLLSDPVLVKTGSPEAGILNMQEAGSISLVYEQGGMPVCINRTGHAVEARVYSLQGGLVGTYKLQPGRNRILDHCEKGVYLIRCTGQVLKAIR